MFLVELVSGDISPCSSSFVDDDDDGVGGSNKLRSCAAPSGIGSLSSLFFI